MSKEEQAEAYLEESRLTLHSARAIAEAAERNQVNLWAQVVKNGYDAMEQAVSAAIAAAGAHVPRAHPAKITTFLDLYEPGPDVEETLLYWLDRRSDSQYVDVRGEHIIIPHDTFDRADAARILTDATDVIECSEGIVESESN